MEINGRMTVDTTIWGAASGPHLLGCVECSFPDALSSLLHCNTPFGIAECSVAILLCCVAILLRCVVALYLFAA